MRLTDSATCDSMNKAYEILKGSTIDELEQIRRAIPRTPMSERNKWIATYCCGETIRRKKAGIWA